MEKPISDIARQSIKLEVENECRDIAFQNEEDFNNMVEHETSNRIKELEGEENV